MMFAAESNSTALLCSLALSVIFTSPQAYAGTCPTSGTFEVDKSQSELRVLIHPAGMLKGMGHSHVISTRDIGGRIEIADGSGTASVELIFPVESFEVDNDALRAEEGREFEKKVSDKDKHGTRKNMLGRKLLDSSKFGTITARLTSLSGELPDISVTAVFVVRDQANTIEFPASVVAGDDRVVVRGKFSVTHGQLGLKPFRAALGTLRVHDEMEMKFRITARLVETRE